MNVDGLNYEVQGRNLLVDVGAVVSKGGIIAPEQSRDKGGAVAGDEAIRVVSISKIGMEALGVTPEQVDKGLWVYLTQFAIPAIRFEHNNRNYALMDVNEVAAFAPNGFNREEWLKEKEEEKQRQKDLTEQKRTQSLGIVTKP